MKDYVQLESKTPEEIYIDQENKQEIIMILNMIKQNIGEKRFDVLWMRFIDGMNQADIAEYYKRSQNTISEFLKRIQKRTINLLEKSNISIEDFYTDQSTLEAHSPKSMGYPHEFLKDVANGGEWKIYKDGRKRYVSKSICKIPEYLSYSFKDNETKCGLCILESGEVKCTRKEVNI
jgi:hypothetical protein